MEVSYGCKVFMRYICDYLADNKDKLGLYTAYVNLDDGYKDYGTIAVVVDAHKCFYITQEQIGKMYEMYSKSDDFGEVVRNLDKIINDFLRG